MKLYCNLFAFRVNYSVAAALIACRLLPAFLSPAHAGENTPRSRARISHNPSSAMQARKDVQAAYDRRSAALSGKDIDGFLAVCTPDYQQTAYNKQVYKVDRLRQTLSHLLSRYPPDFKMTASIRTFQLRGNKATTTAAWHAHLTRTDSQSHKKVPWSSDTITQDVWIKTDKGWRVKRTIEIGFKKQPSPGHKPAPR